MDLTCYLIDDRPVDIRPARNRRKWMNQTPGSYAYQCLPLSIANAHGWEVRCPVTCEAEWNGGSKKDDIQIAFEDEGDSLIGTKKFKHLVETHFGSGILTFNVGVIISTCPGYDLWVSGPVNEFKDGIQALSAVIETYWMPFTFTMNWKFTRPNLKVRFEKGEPFCFFFPIEHGLLERFNPSFKQISENPDLEKQFNFASGKRSFVDVLKILKGKEFEKLEDKDRKRLMFQGWYMKGEEPDGTKVADHKKRVELKPFQMTADKGAAHK
jgi:Family of unknown function (DUF6065)